MQSTSCFLPLNLAILIKSTSQKFLISSILSAPFALTTPLAYELIVGSLHVASANTIPISTSFLLLDRIRAISFVTTNVAKWRLGSTHVSTSVIFVAFLINFTVLVWRTLIAPVRTSPSEFFWKEKEENFFTGWELNFWKK